MKHCFIINPVAGKRDLQQELYRRILNAAEKRQEKYEVYFTIGKKDATEYVRRILKNRQEPVRFYACGGDGTLNEVVNGIAGAQDVSVGMIPCGTGNDFIKNFSGNLDFLNIEAQLQGRLQTVDLIRYGEDYAVNMCNIGFDASVAHNMVRFKRLPLLKGSGAYSMSVLYCLASRLGNELSVQLDDGAEVHNHFLLSLAANGFCYGGGYFGAPRAKVDDGLLDFCAVKKISRFKIMDLIQYYKKGQHLEIPKLEPYITYYQCKKLRFASALPFVVCVDGETFQTREIEFQVVPKALQFIVPERR